MKNPLRTRERRKIIAGIFWMILGFYVVFIYNKQLGIFSNTILGLIMGGIGTLLILWKSK